MPKLYSSKQVIKSLCAGGFVEASQKGSHLKLKNHAGRVVIVPTPRKIICIGTFKKILRQADLSAIEFENLL